MGRMMTPQPPVTMVGFVRSSVTIALGTSAGRMLVPTESTAVVPGWRHPLVPWACIAERVDSESAAPWNYQVTHVGTGRAITAGSRSLTDAAKAMLQFAVVCRTIGYVLGDADDPKGERARFEAAVAAHRTTPVSFYGSHTTVERWFRAIGASGRGRGTALKTLRKLVSRLETMAVPGGVA